MKTFNDAKIKIKNQIGRQYVLCPECSLSRSDTNRSKPCLSVYVTSIHPDAGYWKCHNCGWTGGIKEPDNYKPSYTKVFWHKRPVVIEKDAEYKSSLPSQLVTYFSSRGISERTLEKFGIDTIENHFFPQLEKNLTAVCFPYFIGDETVDIKYRGKYQGIKTFGRVTGAEFVPYNVNSINVEKPLVWVEGEIDVLSIEELETSCGCISPPLGAPQPRDKTCDGKLQFWESFSDIFQSVSQHIIATDNDGPGRRLADELIKRLGPERCWTVEFPEGCKDVNDVLKIHGKEVLSGLLSDACPVPVSCLVKPIGLTDRVFDLFDYGSHAGEPTGWQSVTDLYTIKKKQLTVVTGIPSHGKSNWLDSLCVNIAEKSGWKFLLYSPESMPIERHILQLAAKYTGKPFLKKYTDRMSHAELADAVAFINDHFTFLDYNEDDSDATINSILSKVKAQIAREGLDGVVLDPWNEIEHSRPAHLTETEYIGKILGIIKRFARKYDLHIWVVAHPRIMNPEKLLNGDIIYPVPTPYNIAGSANWRNKPDNCISIWRNVGGTDNITQVHIQKVRFDEVGEVGMAELKFDKRTGRYHEAYVPIKSVEYTQANLMEV